MLSDLAIKRLLIEGHIKIDPFDKEKLGPVSYDVDAEVQDWEGDIARLVSKETFTLSREIAGIVGLRSRAIIRYSAFTSFSPLVDPGYSGRLTFLARLGHYHPGWADDLFQIMFYRVEGMVGRAYNERKSSTAMHRVSFPYTDR